MRIKYWHVWLITVVFVLVGFKLYTAQDGVLAKNERQIIVVNNAEELEVALNNDSVYNTIALKDGVYKDFQITILRSGTSDNPLLLKAETPGGVVFTGETAFVLKGNHIVLSGFYFKADLSSHGMDGGQPVIDIKGDSNRITQCAFWKCHNRASIASLYQEKEDRMPKYTRIDHCYFADNFGWRLYLDLGQRVPGDDLKYAMYYRIDHNYFSTPFKLGANTGSAMRIGLGPLGYGRCLIDNNLFERQNGEVELIENKSHENVYIHNTFKNCESQMSFRQGHRTIFLHNALLGTDPDKKCGGLGMWMDKHLVAGNYFSFPYGSYVPFNANMKIREDRLPAAVIGFKSGCQSFIENGNPVGHFAAQNITFAKNLLFNNKDLLIDFSQGINNMKMRYEDELDIKVSGSFNHQIINNLFVRLHEDKHTIYQDKGSQVLQTSRFLNNKCEGYKRLDNNLNEEGVKVPFPDVLSFNQWLALIPGLDNQIDLVSLANSSVAELGSGANQEMTVIFKKAPLSFEDVGPDWLKENPSDFAKNGKMTYSLKKQIKSLMAK